MNPPPIPLPPDPDDGLQPFIDNPPRMEIRRREFGDDIPDSLEMISAAMPCKDYSGPWIVYEIPCCVCEQLTVYTIAYGLEQLAVIHGESWECKGCGTRISLRWDKDGFHTEALVEE